METLSAEKLSFDTLKTLHGNSLEVKEYLVSNGCIVKVERKVTYASKNVIKTMYLHITITYPDKKVHYYREQKNGTFKGGVVGYV